MQGGQQATYSKSASLELRVELSQTLASTTQSWPSSTQSRSNLTATLSKPVKIQPIPAQIRPDPVWAARVKLARLGLSPTWVIPPNALPGIRHLVLSNPTLVWLFLPCCLSNPTQIRRPKTPLNFESQEIEAWRQGVQSVRPACVARPRSTFCEEPVLILRVQNYTNLERLAVKRHIAEPFAEHALVGQWHKGCGALALRQQLDSWGQSAGGWSGDGPTLVAEASRMFPAAVDLKARPSGRCRRAGLGSKSQPEPEDSSFSASAGIAPRVGQARP